MSLSLLHKKQPDQFRHCLSHRDATHLEVGERSDHRAFKDDSTERVGESPNFTARPVLRRESAPEAKLTLKGGHTIP